MGKQDGAELCFPQLNNSSKKPTIPQSTVVFLHIVLSSVSLLTVFLNLLIIIISVSHYKQLHTPTNILLLSLAVSDFLVGLLLLLGVIRRTTSCWFIGHLTCLLYIYLSLIVTAALVGIMVLMSVDRYVAICYPLYCPTRITDRRVRLCMCLCWLCSVFYSILFVKDYLIQPGKHNSCSGRCVIFVDFIAGTIDLILTFFVPVTVIVVLYMRVFVVAVSQARAMRSHVTAVKIQDSVSLTRKKSELKVARTLGILVLVFLFYCVSLVGEDLLNSSSASIVFFVCYINSCLNPVIYAMFYPWFRKAVKLIITLQILQPGSCEVNIL